MKIKLPKRLRGFLYDRVMPVEMNSFDVDVLLPAVFFQVVSGGKDRGRMANDPEKIVEFIAKLARHRDVEGFDDDTGRRVLDRLVRTSLVQIGRKGISGHKIQIVGMTGYTFLTFKPGFPTETSALRKVPYLIYRMMRNRLSDAACLEFFKEIFGAGVVITGGAEPDGAYDGHTQLDTLTRLSLAFLDGFAATGVRRAKDQDPPEACPALADHMARDLWRYMATYRGRMSAEALTYSLRALINFELLIYSLKLFNAVIELVDDPHELPGAMASSLRYSPPEIYIDFTGQVRGLSRDMAGGCVRRDLETIQRFVRANLTLRQLDLYVQDLQRNRRVGPIINRAINREQKGPEYLQALLLLLQNEDVSRDIDAAARRDEADIRLENAPADTEGEESVEASELDRLVVDAESDFEALIMLLEEAQGTKSSQKTIQWYYSVAGLQKPHGLLHGFLRNRHSWRYAPSNDLLATLVQLAAVEGAKWDPQAPRPQAVSLHDFLRWLDERFGILVDRPPEGFAGAEYAAAAQENLRAMLRRLRQMGIFRDLSDDFTVQRLTLPYADPIGVR